MNVKISFRFLTRILSIVSVVLCVVSLLVSGWENVLRCVSCSFSVGTLSLLAAAEYGENVKLHFVSSIVCGVIPIATGLLDANQGSGNVLCVSVVVLTFARTLERTCSRYYRIKALFRQKAVWTSVEDYYGLTLRLFLVSQCALVVGSGDSRFMEIFTLLFSSALYLIAYYSAYSRRVLLLRHSKETAIKEIIRGNLRTFPMASDDEDARMSNLYSRVTDYMEKRKPFLDEGYDIHDLATAVFSNKTYLSRTINYFSGRNFKQFLNYYRVRYSIELMEKDPRLKVMELASMSGFHSVVTFNMAFKLYVDDTPASYRRQLKARSSLSRASGESEPL